MYLRAPFSGTVGFISFSRGQYVSSGSELMTLDDLSTMRLDLSVPERYLSKLSPNMAVIGITSAWGTNRSKVKLARLIPESTLKRSI